ncbi:mitogen-activated protein kinase kinase kinase 1b-like [Vitis vinifera]|uniref:mitogen-activated protein kinase kinase kinase 1b-like n=1 Tax=Vitis vinifera TaxID=29760 RepID=UPI002882ED04|nr:mitogen-activated protein kinase kinase kinase 1b-like [Vitis vinifera]
MKQVEDKLLRKSSKEQDRVNSAVQSMRDELENERKLRKHSESLHRKLARELSEVLFDAPSRLTESRDQSEKHLEFPMAPLGTWTCCDGLFFAVKEVSLLDKGKWGKQGIYQLEQEISLLSQLEHENIVRYYGTDKDDSKLYIFLELMTKGSLSSLYQKYHLQERQVSAYTKQILNGLKYLHEKNVVHR